MRRSAGSVGRFTNRALCTFQSQYAHTSTARSAEALEMVLRVVQSRIIFGDRQTVLDSKSLFWNIHTA